MTDVQEQPKKIKLTLKQKLFCDWYIKLGGSRHGTQAAIKAGYSEKTAQEMASENLSKPMIQAYLEKRQHEIEDLLGFNKSTIIEDLHEIKARSMQKVPVMRYDPKKHEMVQVTEENEDGQQVGVWQFDSNGANRAIENIGKMLDYYEPEKVKHSNDPDNPIGVTNVTVYLPANGRDKSNDS